MKIKIDKADTLFSDFIRLRDGKCVKCGRLPSPREKDGAMVVGLECSHFWSRRHETTRFDPTNADALCFLCHHRWGGDDREDYRDFKLKQLGAQRFDLLKVKAKSTGKKNRALALVVVRELMKQLEGK